jgi:hypothetical protein
MTDGSSRWLRVPYYNHYQQDPAWMQSHPGLKPRSLDWAFTQPVGKRGAGARMVLIATAFHADPWTGECIYDEAVIRRWTGIGPYALETALRRLAELGLATSERRPDGAIRIVLTGAPQGLEPERSIGSDEGGQS